MTNNFFSPNTEQELFVRDRAHFPTYIITPSLSVSSTITLEPVNRLQKICHLHIHNILHVKTVFISSTWLSSSFVLLLISVFNVNTRNHHSSQNHRNCNSPKNRCRGKSCVNSSSWADYNNLANAYVQQLHIHNTRPSSDGPTASLEITKAKYTVPSSSKNKNHDQSYERHPTRILTW